MTAPLPAWPSLHMTFMFIFTFGAVGVLLVSLVFAEVRDATRGRRGR